MEVLSAVNIITPSAMKYWIKENLEQLFNESGNGGMIETLISMVRYFFRGCF